MYRCNAANFAFEKQPYRRFTLMLESRCVTAAYLAGIRQSGVAQPGGRRCGAEWFQEVCPLPGGARDVAGVPVQAAAGPVMPHRGPRVSMGRRFPHVAQVPYRASRPRMAAP